MEISDQHLCYINPNGVDVQQVLCTFTKILWNKLCYTAWLDPTTWQGSHMWWLPHY